MNTDLIWRYLTWSYSHVKLLLKFNIIYDFGLTIKTNYEDFDVQSYCSYQGGVVFKDQHKKYIKVRKKNTMKSWSQPMLFTS